MTPDQRQQLEHLGQSLDEGQLDNTILLLKTAPSLLPLLAPLLIDPRFRVRAGVYSVLLELADSEQDFSHLAQAISHNLQHPEPVYRGDSTTALGVIGGPEQLNSLRGLLQDSNNQVAQLAKESIEEILERFPDYPQGVV